ncbi:MAG: hypothetical protein KatS3mg131_2150 [Candidatus Tectimicrobiota bacterium]|nr:MAG: hypothetical protein KatS3mg131_2150 [Candidatus Tectomicrobia bacterium]
MKFAYRRRPDDPERLEVEVTPLPGEEERFCVRVGDKAFELAARLLHRVAWLKQGGEILLQYEGREYRLYDAAGQRPPAPPASDGQVRAPMAGKIVRVCVQAGERVQAGDVLVILEAMKMEQPLTAPHDGVVQEVRCTAGEQVSAGSTLVLLAPAAASHSP